MGKNGRLDSGQTSKEFLKFFFYHIHCTCLLCHSFYFYKLSYLEMLFVSNLLLGHTFNVSFNLACLCNELFFMVIRLFS